MTTTPGAGPPAEDAVIALRDVWRRYRVASATRPRRLRASLSRDPLRRRRDQWFWALRGIDLDVRQGEAVAMIGRNGAGKSTLLRLVGGVGRPDRGTTRVSGRIGALVDLGHEFHGDLTGRQNAELAAVVAGMSRQTFRRRFDEIVDFSGLAPFVDEPLRVYSDGMRARLAFSVMAHVDPDVLLVDEVLAVGDAAFQRRSIERIELLRERGAAVVFVSHDLGLVRRVCDRAVWLDHGEIRGRGASDDVVRRYLEAASVDPGGADRAEVTAPGTIGTVRVLDEWAAPAASIRCGDGLVVAIDADLPATATAERVRVRIVRADTDLVVVDTSTPLRPGSDRSIEVVFERLDLAPGAHQVEVGLFSADWADPVDAVEPIPLAVRGEGPDTASLAPPHEWRRS